VLKEASARGVGWRAAAGGEDGERERGVAKLGHDVSRHCQPRGNRAASSLLNASRGLATIPTLRAPSAAVGATTSRLKQTADVLTLLCVVLEGAGTPRWNR